MGIADNVTNCYCVIHRLINHCNLCIRIMTDKRTIMYFCGHNRKMFPSMGIKICFILWSAPKNFTFTLEML